ncbi:HalOD1 output domain-containing protein [Natronosalvus caseinilyticus]|uniref:HalOD1 output domain-containing protein n=1 Tax=Natronosalvus caseinilyticus TaxID=2953747 RepID=UPI0028B0C713|nr:HalOD1 output domain-containing protein [Natronosalvus caseinilyticus]
MLLSADRSSMNEGVPLSFRIVEAVAREEGVDPVEIEPPEYDALYDVLNPEALDSLFAPREDGTPRSPGEVTFTFCGYEMVVESDGEVTILD